MMQSNHFSPEMARVPSDQLDGALPCAPGVHGTFDLTAEARYLNVHKYLEPFFFSLQGP